MTEKEVLDFCDKRKVGIYTHYDFASNSLIVKMRKNNLETETTITREAALSSGFGLTERVILREMANKLDREVQA